MRKPLLVTTVPIPIGDLKLGSLIIDRSHPTQNVYAPIDIQLQDAPTETVLKRTQKNYKTLVRTYSRTALRPHLSVLGWDFTREHPDVAVQIESLEGFTYELRNPLQWFNALIEQPGSREWLQTMNRRAADVFLVTGCRSLRDARVTLNRKQQKTNGINVMVDIGMVASAAAGAPLPVPTGQEIGIQAEQKTLYQQNEQYVAPGEQVFAIQYKKLKFKTFPRDGVRQASVGLSTLWEDVLVHHGEAAPANLIAVQLDDAVQVGRPTTRVSDEGEEDIYFVVDGDH
ncbi:uncharacterized protein Aud_008890 [Aspergillus udagawae]|uniref:Uncharacterized protein n=1 Tax=Aspergillus udagawae TaxID=91492 RepID=A0A8E0QWB2_9EURO|nr:uncharacterized protein Aud_008890 [Aspergillus udagawae]GIC92424.1 hypothetical protein Aud_008890 [Aspergillus udagawae]